MLTVVKVGGGTAGAPDLRARIAPALARLHDACGAGLVIVHGGGAEISAWYRRLDLEVAWYEGLRVTTPEGLRVTSMVLSGWVNKRLVQALLDGGLPAVGLSGEDGGILRARRALDGRIGEVGEVVAVDPGAVRALLTAGFVPVLSPLSRGLDGAPLNVNADEAALHLAGGLGADRILMVSDVPGVVAAGAVLGSLHVEEARGLLEQGVATGGMAVKLRQALIAAERGVDVVIGDEAILSDPGSGTRIHALGTVGAA